MPSLTSRVALAMVAVVLLAIGCMEVYSADPMHPADPIHTADPRKAAWRSWRLDEIARTLSACYRPSKDIVTARLTYEFSALCRESGPKHDILLVVDTTASMGRTIDDARAAVPAMTAASARGCGVALFFFRDEDDAFLVKRAAGLADPASSIVESFKHIRALGGGSWTEPTWTALNAAALEYANAGASLPGHIVLLSDGNAHSDRPMEDSVRAHIAGGLGLTVIDARPEKSDPRSFGCEPPRMSSE